MSSQEKPKDENRLPALQRWLSIFAGSAVFAATLIAAFSTFTSVSFWKNTGIALSSEAVKESLSRYSEESRELVRAETEKINARVDTVEKQLSTLAKIPPENAAAAQLASAQKSVDDISTRIGKLELVILQDPAKALEMPLLRNQLEGVKSGYQSDLLSVRQEIAQVYDLNKWFVGLMFTMALGIIGLAVTNFLKAGAKDSGSKG